MDHRRSALLVVLTAALVVLLARPAAAAVGPDPEIGRQWGLLDIKAPDAWPKGRGGGVSVAVVSTGIAEHPDLKVKLDAGFDATGGAPTADTDGRGTHLAGIVAAATDNALGIAGVAPSARLLPYKAFESGSADDTYLKALDRALATKPGVVLVDLPSDYTGDVGQLRAKLKALGDGGASVVVGAQDVIAASALNDLPVLAVAATARGGSGTGAVGARGVAAPGVGILSTTVKQPALPTGTPTYDYAELDGTGQAAAHVAGAVAILRGHGANAAEAADLLRS
ncbi:MAG: S8 family serine peptidase, partial [Acidimicrobiales bacterium]